MAYIGRSENFGVRSRFQYQATASQTSFSGSDVSAGPITQSATVTVNGYWSIV
jgi:hypothetical protein